MEETQTPAYYVSRFKLHHDCEQLEYLMHRGGLSRGYADLTERWRQLLGQIPQDAPRLFKLTRAWEELLGPEYGRVLYRHAPEAQSTPVLRAPDVLAEVDRDLSQGLGIGMIRWIDDLLSLEAFEGLRRHFLESIMWHDVKAETHLAARVGYGLRCGLIDQLVGELQRALPVALGGRKLKNVWAFKIGPKHGEIGPHVDGRGISVNLWFTPDSANLIPSKGGMLFYRGDPLGPENRSEISIRKIKKLLHANDARATPVEYRANRAVFFDSSLLHESDICRFAETYVSYRTNLALRFE